MTELLHEILLNSAAHRPEREALRHKQHSWSYGELAADVQRFASVLLEGGLGKQERVAVYLPKQPETVSAFFATALAGGVFVPVNPLLKPAQVEHILTDCNVRVLVTSRDRARMLSGTLRRCPDLRSIVLTDHDPESVIDGLDNTPWDTRAGHARRHRVIDTDMAAILYTSGSTGRPKGVVLSHRNMVTGAQSVTAYLGNTENDRLLCVLPFSFDYGFSQLSTVFHSGGVAVLLEYLLPRDVIKACAREAVTGLAGVPPLWVQLGRLDWPDEVKRRLRYITNSGGTMPRATLKALRTQLPKTQVFLMYGLTEAFRSTYLHPELVDEKPDSIGQAIPNADVIVVRPDGTRCDPGETGELVHCGSLVAMGYWNDPEKTQQRFRPAPGRLSGLTLPEPAVWSGDSAHMDEDGDLYFVGRRDEMIKTSGYRVSPTEIEEVAYESGLVNEVCVVGPVHPELGQAVVLIATPAAASDEPTDALLSLLGERLPTFMSPKKIIWRDDLPRNPNGKLDRSALAQEYATLFREPAA